MRAALAIYLDKSFKRAVIGSFDVVGEQAGGQLPILPVIVQAVAAFCLAAAAWIGAVASLEVVTLFAFHSVQPTRRL